MVVALGPERAVKYAGIRDLAYVVSLQRRWSNEVGFLCKTALRHRIERRQVLIVRQEALEAGYVIHGAGSDGVLCVPQVAVSAELLRTRVGSLLLRWVVLRARECGCSVVRLRSLEHLEANRFWPTIGFQVTAVLRRRTARGSALVEWTLALPVTTGEGSATPAVRWKR